jgi:hypothetical protein
MSILHSQYDDNYPCSKRINILGIVRIATLTVSSHDCSYRPVLYLTVVRSKPEYSSLVWNSINSTDGNKLTCIQRKFAALHFNCVGHHVHYSYANALKYFDYL